MIDLVNLWRFLFIQLFLFNAESEDLHYFVCNTIPGKCPGVLRNTPGHTNYKVKPDKYFQAKAPSDCPNKCEETSWCYFAQYIPTIKECQLFRHYQPYVEDLSSNAIYWWECCADSRHLCVKVPGRFAGFVALYGGYRLVQPRRGPVQKWNYSSLVNAFDNCLRSSVCGSVNLNYNTKGIDAEMMQRWPIDQSIRVKNANWSLATWVSCNFEDPLRQNCTSRSGPLGCSGYWVDANQSAWPPRSGKYVTQFHTLDLAKCWEECQLQPLCSVPWYNQTTSECLLQSNVTSNDTCAGKESYHISTTMKSWEWVCCSPSSSTELVTRRKIESSCLCIRGKKNVVLTEDDCLRPNLRLKRHIRNGMAFKYLDRTFQTNDTVWYYVFNGLDKLWLGTTSDNATQECPDIECKIYSGSVFQGKYPEIVSLNEWYARPPVGKLDILKKKPKYVIIGTTDIPSCSCYTSDNCADQVRRIQTWFIKDLGYQDIPYNFVVGLDGKVYEGRGWKYKSAMSYEYNPLSIGIAFIGSFNNTAPTIAALTATKQLIQYGFEMGFISKEYILYGHRDLRRMNVDPGDVLYAIIHNWFRYHNQHFDTPTDCLKNNSLGLLSLILFAVSILTVLAIYLKKRNYHVNICRQIQRTSESRAEDRLILPFFYDTVEEGNWHDFVLLERCNNIEQRIRLTHANVFIVSPRNSMDICPCRRLLLKLVNIADCSGFDNLPALLNSAYFLKICMRKSAIVFMIPHNPLEKPDVGILHLDSITSMQMFIGRLQKRKCICKIFHIDSYTNQFNESISPLVINFTTCEGNPTKQYGVLRRRYKRTFNNGDLVLYDSLQIRR